MSAHRAWKRLIQQCLRCKLPVARHPTTDEPLVMCRDHLDDDKARVARRASKIRKAKR